MSLLQITGYKKLYLDVENLRKVTYDSDNEEHEEQLIEVKKKTTNQKQKLYPSPIIKSSSCNELGVKVALWAAALMEALFHLQTSKPF